MGAFLSGDSLTMSETSLTELLETLPDKQDTPLKSLPGQWTPNGLGSTGLLNLFYFFFPQVSTLSYSFLVAGRPPELLFFFVAIS